jgi:hypothetical protein
MRSEEARIGEAVAVLTARLDAWGVDDAATRASEYVRDMVRQGWRPRALPVETGPTRPPQADAVPADAVPTYRQARAALNTPGGRP